MRFIPVCVLLLIVQSAISQVQKIKPVENSVFELVMKTAPAKSFDNVAVSGEKRKAPENESLRLPFNNYEKQTKADRSVQNTYGRSLKTAGSQVNILGTLPGLESDGIEPSDNTLTVGNNHIIQMVNSASTSMRIWDKSGNLLAGNINITSLVGTNLGDPNIIYDYEADRYVFLVIGGSLTRANITICISETNDPLGNWLIYKVKAGGLFSPLFPDYPKLGVWGNAYIVTTNASGPNIYAINRDSMIAGATTTASKLFKLTDFPGGGVQTASPVTVIGQNGVAANSPAVVLRPFDAAWTSSTTDVDVLEIYTLQIDWDNEANNSISAPLKLPTSEYDFRLCSDDFNASTCIPQKGVGQKLDALGGIIYDKSQYRNFGSYESIVCTHMTDGRNNGIASARWYELRRTGGDWEIFQQGTYAPEDGTHRFLSGISINDKGSIALGYNISSADVYPDIALTARKNDDPSGVMTALETTMQFGAGGQTSSNRYGDYNGMVCDPVDGSFWFTANYTPFTRNWVTSVVHFEVQDEVMPVTLLDFRLSALDKTVGLIWSTTQEINNDHFEIERSIDGIKFANIGKVAAIALSSTINNYSFSDKLPVKGTGYYRLKQVDKDGKYAYSSVKQVYFNGTKTSTVLYPNPAKNIVNLEFEASKSSVENLIITNLSGVKVQSIKINILEGYNKTSIPLNGQLANGQYWIQFSVDNIEQKLKLIVQH